MTYTVCVCISVYVIDIHNTNVLCKFNDNYIFNNRYNLNLQALYYSII